MLAYAANAPRHAERRSSPHAMLVVISVHVAVVAAVMSAKMDLPTRLKDGPLEIIFVPAAKDPPPQPVIEPRVPQSRRPSAIDRPPQQIPLPPTGSLPTVDATPSLPNFDAMIGSTASVRPSIDPLPAPVRTEARLLTPAAELKPPYPHSKLLTEEEAVLKLRLTIDERGRVVAVEPLGRTDRVFLEAARRHLITHWRYKPASEGGRAIPATTVITLRFQLDG